MKSSNSWPENAIEYARARISRFVQSPIMDEYFFVAYLELVSAESGHSELDNVLPILIARAKRDRLSFKILKRLCAHYENNEHQKPRELSVWLFNMLRDIEVEPKKGKTGPNKSETEDLFLLGLTATMAEKFERPIYPSISTGENGSILQVIALASSEVKRELGRSIFPFKTEPIRRRYMKAKRLIELRTR